MGAERQRLKATPTGLRRVRGAIDGGVGIQPTRVTRGSDGVPGSAEVPWSASSARAWPPGRAVRVPGEADRLPQSRPNPRGGSSLSSAERSSVHISSSLCAVAVIAFDLDKCPADWDEFVVAKGRFLRGMTDSEEHGQPGGTAKHLHNASTETSGAVRGVDNDDDHTVSNWDHYHAVKVEEQEHLPEYVAVLFCRLKE